MRRKKQPPTSDVKIKAFVALLALCIVFLVGYAYVMYHTKVLTRLYFDKVKLDKHRRHIEIFAASGGAARIVGQLGGNIHASKPFACLDRPANATAMCLEWDSVARLHMSHQPGNESDCYTIEWHALTEAHFPQVK